MKKSQPEVLIVGAGPVGLLTAIELKRRGIHPRIIDKGMGLRAYSRALNINARSLEILEPSGVAHKLLARGNRLRRTYLVEDGKTTLTLRIEALRHRYPFTLVIPQTVTEMLLYETVIDLGLAVEWNTELMELSFSGRIATAALVTADSAQYVTPDYLIAADGARGCVRKFAGMDLSGKIHPMVFALADIRYRIPRDPSFATIELLRGGAIASFPIDAHVSRHIGTSDKVISTIRQRRADNHILWSAEFHVNLGCARDMRHGNVYLAGDAAHISSPVGARGMNLGFEDAAWLAWLIAKGKAEERYAKERLPVARRVIDFTRRQTYQLFESSGRVQKFTRRYLASPLFSVPLVEQTALRSLAGLDTPDPPWLKRG